MSRKPCVRTTSDERATLAAYSTEGLALRIVEIGESMRLAEARMEKERQKTEINAASLERRKVVYCDCRALRQKTEINAASLEALHLAQTRADLLAIAAEIDRRVRALSEAVYAEPRRKK